MSTLTDTSLITPYQISAAASFLDALVSPGFGYKAGYDAASLISEALQRMPEAFDEKTQGGLSALPDIMKAITVSDGAHRLGSIVTTENPKGVISRTAAALRMMSQKNTPVYLLTHPTFKAVSDVFSGLAKGGISRNQQALVLGVIPALRHVETLALTHNPLGDSARKSLDRHMAGFALVLNKPQAEPPIAMSPTGLMAAKTDGLTKEAEAILTPPFVMPTQSGMELSSASPKTLERVGRIARDFATLSQGYRIADSTPCRPQAGKGPRCA